MPLAAELSHLLRRISTKEWLGYVLAAVVFGYVVPARYGIEFLDIYFLLAYVCLPGVFVAPMVADSVLGWRPTSETAGSDPARLYIAQVLAAVIFAWVWGLIVLGVAILIANQNSPIGEFLLPPGAILWNAVLLGTAIALFAASAAGWLALNSKTAAEAKKGSRRVFLLVLLSVVMWMRMGPGGGKRALDARLMPGRITSSLLPVTAFCTLAGLAAIRFGARRKAEEAEGPLFKL